MILAAGFGTRLGELTKVRPKPMLPICGAPLVRWSALWLRAQGVREIVVNLHHLGEQIADELGDGSELGLDIAYSHEEGLILGTGGGLREARHLLDDGHDSPIIVVNGKILVDLDLRPVLEAHARRDAEATMVLRPDAEGIWGGSLAADPSSGTLATFLGETRPGATTGPAMMFTGIHVIQPRFLDRVPAEGEQCIVRTAYRQLFADPRGIDVHTHDGYWWEHSTVERYLQGIANLLDGRAALPWAERPIIGVDPSAKIGPGAELDPRVHVGPGAEIGAGAKIGPYVQIGARAKVAAGVRVERAAVWPGASLDHDLEAGVRI
ncbi:D-glycero-alpha-D-manno-heptose 1-phosphate guanylyltransferase [Enhygromyxa salina]|uniref:D-glycero-alpha-D-manno-heptose 1-phosphate guanylyltransferase n=1 Tax=Enhygromyxa salina TaxID=215803 RepID=A0A2S9XBY1_9BACT|nr:NDP-sugar synthase [Enhygromyxa salina]PRP90310.1 D-glycero-alpha-D-manno-heptose 1-phosphate guanylyltransferase [Enhygromyxa salina]